MSEKFLTVIIPFCNKDILYVISLLQTIDDQSDVNWEEVEIICCSSSTDDAPYPFPTFKSFEPKFICKSSIINGPGISRNLGIDNASGKYIIMIDADDTFRDQKSLSDLVNTIKSHEIIHDFDAIIFPAMRSRATGITIDDPSIPKIYPMVLWHYVISKSFLTQRGLTFRKDCRYWEDIYFCCKAVELRMRAVYDSQVWYVHKERPDSSGALSLLTFSALQDMYISTMDFVREFPESGDSVWFWMESMCINSFYRIWIETEGFSSWSIEERRIALIELKLWGMWIYPKMNKINELQTHQQINPEALAFMNRVLSNDMSLLQGYISPTGMESESM